MMKSEEFESKGDSSGRNPEEAGSKPGAYLLWIPSGDGGGNVFLAAFLLKILRFKFLLFVAFLAGLLAGIGISFIVPAWYQAESLVLPVQEEGATSALSGTFGQLGGLASLAGVDLGAADTQREETLAILSSFTFASGFIKDNGIALALARDRKKILAGLSDEEFTRQDPPVKLVNEFREEILRIREVEGTSLVRVGIRWEDRLTAAVWAGNVVAKLNETLRAQAIADANRQIDLLRQRLDQTVNLEIRNLIYRLLEAQLHKIVLADARREFALRIIDPAVVPDADDHVWPNRLMFAILGALAASGLALAFVVMRLARQRAEKP